MVPLEEEKVSSDFKFPLQETYLGVSPRPLDEILMTRQICR